MSSRGCESSSKIKTEQDHAIVMKEGVREGNVLSCGFRTEFQASLVAKNEKRQLRAQEEDQQAQNFQNKWEQ